jgi:hypothetical protein
MIYSRGGPHCMILLKTELYRKPPREEKQQRKRKTQGRDSRKLN